MTLNLDWSRTDNSTVPNTSNKSWAPTGQSQNPTNIEKPTKSSMSDSKGDYRDSKYNSDKYSYHADSSNYPPHKYQAKPKKYKAKHDKYVFVAGTPNDPPNSNDKFHYVPPKTENTTSRTKGSKSQFVYPENDRFATYVPPSSTSQSQNPQSPTSPSTSARKPNNDEWEILPMEYSTQSESEPHAKITERISVPIPTKSEPVTISESDAPQPTTDQTAPAQVLQPQQLPKGGAKQFQLPSEPPKSDPPTDKKLDKKHLVLPKNAQTIPELINKIKIGKAIHEEYLDKLEARDKVQSDIDSFAQQLESIIHQLQRLNTQMQILRSRHDSDQTERHRRESASLANDIDAYDKQLADLQKSRAFYSQNLAFPLFDPSVTAAQKQAQMADRERQNAEHLAAGMGKLPVIDAEIDRLTMEQVDMIYKYQLSAFATDDRLQKEADEKEADFESQRQVLLKQQKSITNKKKTLKLPPLPPDYDHTEDQAALDILLAKQREEKIKQHQAADHAARPPAVETIAGLTIKKPAQATGGLILKIGDEDITFSRPSAPVSPPPPPPVEPEAPQITIEKPLIKLQPVRRPSPPPIPKFSIDKPKPFKLSIS